MIIYYIDQHDTYMTMTRQQPDSNLTASRQAILVEFSQEFRTHQYIKNRHKKTQNIICLG